MVCSNTHDECDVCKGLRSSLWLRVCYWLNFCKISTIFTCNLANFLWNPNKYTYTHAWLDYLSLVRDFHKFQLFMSKGFGAGRCLSVCVGVNLMWLKRVSVGIIVSLWIPLFLSLLIFQITSWHFECNAGWVSVWMNKSQEKSLLHLLINDRNMIGFNQNNPLYVDWDAHGGENVCLGLKNEIAMDFSCSMLIQFLYLSDFASLHWYFVFHIFDFFFNL